MDEDDNNNHGMEPRRSGRTKKHTRQPGVHRRMTKVIAEHKTNEVKRPSNPVVEADPRRMRVGLPRDPLMASTTRKMMLRRVRRQVRL